MYTKLLFVLTTAVISAASAPANGFELLKNFPLSGGQGNEVKVVSSHDSSFAFTGTATQFELRTSQVFDSPEIEFLYTTDREKNDPSAVSYAGLRNNVGYLSIYYIYGDQPAFVKIANGPYTQTCYPYRVTPINGVTNEEQLTPEYFRAAEQTSQIETSISATASETGRILIVTLRSVKSVSERPFRCALSLQNFDTPFRPQGGKIQLFVGGNRSSAKSPWVQVESLQERVTRDLRQ